MNRQQILATIVDPQRSAVLESLPNLKEDFEKDGNSRLKERIKAVLKSRYSLFVMLFSPIMPRIALKSRTTLMGGIVRAWADSGMITVQLGSGPNRLHSKIINVDLVARAETDCVADCHSLPFRDCSIDAVFHANLLEHVRDPEKATREIHRVLKPGGRLACNVPFLQPFHGSPSDHTRWTREGLLSLHERAGFESEDIQLDGGPTSALLWVLQEYLAVSLSFGSRRLYSLLWWLQLPFLAPFKILDAVLVHHPEAHRLASALLWTGRKPAASLKTPEN